MIRRPLIQPDLQKHPQTQRTPHPPRDASFALNPFKETDQHHPEVHPRSKITGGAASRDRTGGSRLRRTRRSLPVPTLCSVADRKDGPELPPDPCDTTPPLATDAGCAFPSPCLQLNRKLPSLQSELKRL